jgi:hypothetical protein
MPYKAKNEVVIGYNADGSRITNTEIRREFTSAEIDQINANQKECCKSMCTPCSKICCCTIKKVQCRGSSCEIKCWHALACCIASACLLGNIIPLAQGHETLLTCCCHDSSIIPNGIPLAINSLIASTQTTVPSISSGLTGVVTSQPSMSALSTLI